ncbi:MAG: hypothetical protein WBA76_13375 [Phormidesmis sp.]
MESVRVRRHVGQDGILYIEIPVGLTDQEVEATVVYQPVQVRLAASPSLGLLYGICADDPIRLDSQGILEDLDDNLDGAFD